MPPCRISATTRQRTEATAAKLAGLAGKDTAEAKWDSSSRVGDLESRGPLTQLQAAEEFLQENPELKNVHSIASTRTLLSKTEQQIQQAVS